MGARFIKHWLRLIALAAILSLAGSPLVKTTSAFAASTAIAAEPGGETATADQEKADEDLARADEEKAKAEEEQAKAEEAKARELKRQEALAEALEASHTTDRQVSEHIPSVFSFLVNFRLLGISLWRYLVAAAVIALVIVLLWRTKKLLAADQSKLNYMAGSGWHMGVNVARLAMRNPVKLLVCGLALKIMGWLFVTSYHLETMWISDMMIFIAFVVYLYDLAGLIDKYFGRRIFHSTDRLLETLRPLALKLVRLVILLVAVMHIYQSVTGQTLVSVLAGLGIGGLALALASQEWLKNLLGFATIATDQPFFVGDSVVVGADEGTIERIGMRSTRVRAWDGTAIIVPNANAITSSVRNKSRRPFLRNSESIALHPANPPEKVELAIQVMREALENHLGSMPDRPPVVRFEDWQPARLIVTAYFWVDPSEESGFYDEISRVNLEMHRRLSEAGVLFAER